jgi:23S rRNA pseudouridine1911/1915/1917 synthase
MKLARITRAGSGKPAVTAYRVLETSEHACLIEARPVTGRLHQVRLHLEAIGAPILGDTLYGPRRVHGATPRLALHSHRVVFTHPVTGETIDVHTKIPKDFKRMMKNFRLSGRTEPAAEEDQAE